MRVDLMAMGARVCRARERAGHGQRELADGTGIPRTYLSRLVGGRRSPATLEQLNLLARVLGVDLPAPVVRLHQRRTELRGDHRR
jgi:transcriptional regulator with XRE-family HTH domain